MNCFLNFLSDHFKFIVKNNAYFEALCINDYGLNFGQDFVREKNNNIQYDDYFKNIFKKMSTSTTY